MGRRRPARPGLAEDPAHPGFRHFFLQPELDPTGRITRVVVPANTTATLRMPAVSPGTVLDGSVASFRLPSGDYDLSSMVS